ncbi:MAG: FAD-binding oxidoreductase [Pseudomonadota bacterium]
MSTNAIAELKRGLGPSGFREGADMAPHLVDWSAIHHGDALLVARPQTTEQVSQVVKTCAEHGIAIVPQGGNTGLCGGAIPRGDLPCIILSLARMNRILSVDPECYTITAEAGTTLQSLQDAAAAVDRTFAMDWGARGSAMVGGGISTNGGGLNVLRFGTTRDQVLGLEVVLPDGRVWDGLRALRKDTSGYDLKHLFIGGEGTLGIVTKAVLKLHPRQPLDQSMFGAVADVTRLMELFALAQDITADALSAFELIPGSGMLRATEQVPALIRPFETDAAWCVLIRLSGRAAERLEELLVRLSEAAFAAGLLNDAVVSQSLAQEQNLWHLRDEILGPRLYEGMTVKWDVSVPIDRIIPFVQQAEAIVAAIQPEARFYAFGHVGDGNLHVYVWPQGNPGPARDALCAQIYQQVDALIWRMGGSICAEHGVGVVNISRIVGQKSAIEHEMMQKLRALFDPQGIMNPGKMIEHPGAPGPS